MTTPILQSILTKSAVIIQLSASERKFLNSSNYRDKIKSLNNDVSQLISNVPDEFEFKKYLDSIHDILVTADINVKSQLIRSLRFCCSNKVNCTSIVTAEIHFIMVVSLERDPEFIIERIQSLKLMKTFLSVQSQEFPIAFSRSIVAVANQKDDNLRRVCIETLREICVLNPKIVARSNGFVTLIDAILDPQLFDMMESIMLSVLFAFNNDETRKYVLPYLDLRSLIAPMTDLDSENSAERSAVWKSSKSAFLIAMRTWVGIVQLTSDDLGLPTLVKLLRDPKVATSQQDVILESFCELFQPIISKVTKSRKTYNISAFSSVGDGPDSFRDSDSTISTDTNTSSGGSLSRTYSDNALNKKNSQPTDKYISMMEGGISSGDRASVVSERPSTSFLGLGNNRGSIATSNIRDSTTGREKQKPSSFLSNLFSSNKLGVSPTKESKTTSVIKRGSTNISDLYGGSAIAKLQQSVGALGARLNSSHGVQGSKPDHNSPTFNIGYSDPNPIYNLLDNYAALLCCAFIHSKIIDSLSFLATHVNNRIANRSRMLMVDILRTIANIFPDSMCSELLTMPSLVEFAALTSATKGTIRAQRASQILSDMADAFAVTPLNDLATRNGGLTNGNMLSSMLSVPPFKTQNISGKGSYDDLNSAAAGIGMGSGRISVGGSLPSNKAIPGGLSSSVPSSMSHVSSSVSSRVSYQIFDLTEDVKQSAQSRLAGLLGNTISARSKMLQDLRMVLTSSIDKTDLTKQMENTRILGKDGKEPLKWDWPLINDMLEYSFHNTDRLTEALKTKWVRRLSGFYRCSTDEKGYFANMDWEVSNLQYLECACNLYHVLVEDYAGINFLKSDRRGVVFNDIDRELQSLVASIMANWSGGGGVMMSKNVFRISSCQHSMGREYFTLLGRLTTTPGGRKILQDTTLVEHLTSIGSHKNLDYLSRLVITSLSFTDKGFLSKHLFQTWGCNPHCSTDLLQFMISLLFVLLQCRPYDFLSWGVDVLYGYLSNDEISSSVKHAALKILLVACEDKTLLQNIISKRFDVIADNNARPIVTRIVSVSEGLQYLENSKRLTSELEYWKCSGCRDYVIQVETLLSKALNGFHQKTAAKFLSLSPIPVCVKAFAAFSLLQCPLQDNDNSELYKTGSNATGSALGTQGYSSGIGNIIAPINMSETSLQQSLDCNAAAVDLEGLIRSPWNIEIMLTQQTNYHSAANSPQSAEYLKVDSFLDVSEIPHPLCSDCTSDANRIVRVRGIIVDGRGLPTGHPIAANRIISNTLMIGASPVFRNGTVAQLSETIRSSKKRNVGIPTATANAGSGRESVTANVRRTSIGAIGTPVSNILLDLNEVDLPITYQLEQFFDWSVCKPGHRQSNTKELGDGIFAVEIGDEPMVWIFSRNVPGYLATANASNKSRSSSIGSSSSVPDRFSSNNNRTDMSRSGGFVYLIEVQYFLRLETGQSTFVPMPRHMYGEIVRTTEGLAMLSRSNVISDLLSIARDEFKSCKDRTSALWGLGHLAAEDRSFNEINTLLPTFVEWCINNVVSCPNFALRGTFFYVLGLISRSTKGSRKLLSLNWSSTPRGSISAVAIPRNPSQLFLYDFIANEAECFDPSLAIPPHPITDIPITINIKPGSASLEIELLNLISKLPGVIAIFKDSKSKIERIRSQHPEVFTSRKLYLTIHKMFESYSFKLTVRRELMKLFAVSSRIRSSLEHDSPSGATTNTPTFI